MGISDTDTAKYPEYFRFVYKKQPNSQMHDVFVRH